MSKLKTISEYKRQHFKEPTPFLTGWYEFDSASGGLFPGELTILGGRPAMGKTDLLIKIALWLEQAGKDVIFLTPRQDLDLLVKKFSTIKSNPEIMSGGNYNKPDIERIYLYTEYNTIVENISEIIENTKESSHDLVLMIDNLANLDSEIEFHKEHYKIQHYMTELKDCAVKNNIPVIATVGMNRKADARMGMKYPFMSDLRGSGEIEEIADKVGLIYRPEYYGITEYNDGTSTLNITELIFAKNSYAKTGSFSFLNHFDYYDEPQYSEYSFNKHLDE
jgi:replicative DNA helicase